MANGIIDRTGADALIPLQLANEIFKGVTEDSSVLSLARRLPDMTAKQMRLPVASALAEGYFVGGDTGLKQTTALAWKDKFIVAEEIAVIVPVADAVLADSAYDIWGEVKPAVLSAFGKVIDRAILLGIGKPATWPEAIVPGAAAASKAVIKGTKGNLYMDIMGEEGVEALVETSGYMINGFAGAMSMRGALRGTVDDNGQPIFRPMTGMQGATEYRIDGQPAYFPRNGSILPTDNVLLIGGDWSQLVYSIRQDLTVKLLTEAVISDTDGKIVYNLAQQDMSALRFVMRLGWQLPNPVNALDVSETTRYPFAVLTKA